MHFHWPPEVVDRLTMDQHEVYVAVFKEMDREAKAQEMTSAKARRNRS